VAYTKPWGRCHSATRRKPLLSSSSLTLYRKKLLSSGLYSVELESQPVSLRIKEDFSVCVKFGKPYKLVSMTVCTDEL
jgi:hypothetical protein